MARRDRGRPVVEDDWFRVRWIADPDLSSEGRRVAYEVAYLDRDADRIGYQVHWREVDGAAGGCLTAPGTADRAPRWAPDGPRVAVLSDESAGWRTRIVDVETGRAHAAAQVAGSVQSVDWAPDGRRLVAVVREPDAGAVEDLPYEVESLRYRVDALGVRPRQARLGVWVQEAEAEGRSLCLTDDPWEEWAAGWSPQGDRIAFLSCRREDREWSARTGLWVMAPDGSRRRRLVPEAGPIRALAWSPDGRQIAYLGHRHGDTQGENTELWVVDSGGGPARRVSDVDRSLGLVVRGEDERGFGPPDLAWTADGRSIVVARADGGTSQVEAFDLDGRHVVLVGGSRACLAFGVARSADGVAFVASDPGDPGELSIVRGDGPAERRMTNLNDRWLAELDLARPVPLRHVSGDGFEVDGWLTLPPTESPGAAPARRHATPLVLEVHGGPHYPVGLRFAIEVQRLAGRGYAVLTGNPRGSQGYGARFATAIRGDWGGGDFRDLMGLVDAALEHEAIDPGRLAMMGESYGGYATTWAIGHTDRFRAAVTENGLSDLLAAYAGPGGPGWWRSEMGGTPWTRPRAYVDRSPIRYAGRIRTPLLILHAELDQNCPTAQSDELFTALRELGREVSYVRIPGEGHLVNLFGRPSRRAARRAIIDGWLDHHLRDGGRS